MTDSFSRPARQSGAPRVTTSSPVTRAVAAGNAVGVTVDPWGSDMVRLNRAMIMSAADAIGWGIARAAAKAAR